MSLFFFFSQGTETIYFPAATVTLLITKISDLMNPCIPQICKMIGDDEKMSPFLAELAKHLRTYPKDHELKHFHLNKNIAEILKLEEPERSFSLASIVKRLFSKMSMEKSKAWLEKIQPLALSIISTMTEGKGAEECDKYIEPALFKSFLSLFSIDNMPEDIVPAFQVLQALALKVAELKEINEMDEVTISKLLGPCLFNVCFDHGKQVEEKYTLQIPLLFHLFNQAFLYLTWPMILDKKVEVQAEEASSSLLSTLGALAKSFVFGADAAVYRWTHSAFSLSPIPPRSASPVSSSSTPRSASSQSLHLSASGSRINSSTTLRTSTPGARSSGSSVSSELRSSSNARPSSSLRTSASYPPSASAMSAAAAAASPPALPIVPSSSSSSAPSTPKPKLQK